MIKRMYKNHADFFACVSLYIFSLTFLLIMASRLNIPPVIDEVATVASPMYLAGYDWSETLHAMGGYYFKYGGGMVYYPLVVLIKDPYVLYRSMLAFNAVVCSFIPVIAFVILKKHFGVRRSSSWVMSLITFCLPVTALYTLYARADAMLIFTPWLIALIILTLVKISVSGAAGEEKKRFRRKKVILSILLALVTCASYSLHTRGIAVVLAVIVTVLIVSLILKTRIVAVIPSVLTLGAALFIDNAIASFFKEALYSHYGTSFSSTESFDFGALSNIFTKDGFKAFVAETLGAAFNMIVSTYGLVILGVVIGTVVVIRFIRKRSEASNSVMVFTSFSVILFLGTFAMSIIYFFPYVYDLLKGTGEQRSDWLVYGRYAACGCGPCVLAGLYLCMQKKEKIYTVLKAVSAVIFAGVSILFLFKVAPLIEGVSAVTRNFISLCTFAELKSEGITTAVVPGVTGSFAWAALLSGAVLTVIIVLSLITKKVYTLYAAALFLFVVSVIITFVDYDKIRLSRDEKLMDWIAPVAQVITDDPTLSDSSVYVAPGAKSIKHYQFVLYDHICFSEGSDLSTDAANAVIASKKEYPEGFKMRELISRGSSEYPRTAKDRVYIRKKFYEQVMKDYAQTIIE